MHSHSLVLRNPLDVPTHCCGAAFYNTLSLMPRRSALVPLVAQLHRCVVPCSRLIISSVLAESTFPSLCLLAQATPPPPCLASATGHRCVASCHASLTEWHQCVLSLSSSPLPSTPQRVSALDTVLSSLTQILFDGASFHSRQRPATTPPCFRRRQPPGMMRATMPLFLATVLGVTFAALAHMRIRLVSAFYVSSFTALCVPPRPTSGTNEWLDTGIPGWRPPSFNAPGPHSPSQFVQYELAWSSLFCPLPSRCRYPLACPLCFLSYSELCVL